MNILTQTSPNQVMLPGKYIFRFVRSHQGCDHEAMIREIVNEVESEKDAVLRAATNLGLNLVQWQLKGVQLCD